MRFVEEQRRLVEEQRYSGTLEAHRLASSSWLGEQGNTQY